MKRKSRREKTVKELILKDDEFLHLTTSVEGPLGYENSKDYRLSVVSDGGLIVEKMTPVGWRRLRWFLMKCVKCKFKDRNTGVCTYPFAVVAVGDKVLDKKGNVVGCAHGRKK